ncbi:UNVERIFIED_ORG: hypothetical protein L601_006900000030 [Gordonia westfalica J30]
MARAQRDETTVTIVFAWWEAPFVGRRRLVLDAAEIDSVSVEDRPLRVHLGPRAGLWVTGLVKVGIFDTTSRCLTAVRRGTPALHLRLVGGRAFREVLISDARAHEMAARL